jgi:hypothetical protein
VMVASNAGQMISAPGQLWTVTNQPQLITMSLNNFWTATASNVASLVILEGEK